MRDLEDQLRRYGDGVEPLVPNVDVPVERSRVRRWPTLGAAAAIVVAVIAAAIAFSSDDEDDRFATAGEVPGSPVETPQPAEDGDCLPGEELPEQEGLVGSPVTEVLPSELRGGFVPGQLWAYPITGRQLEGVWYIVSTALTDVGGRPLGVGLWLMPDSIVARAGDSWHLYPANGLAVAATTGLPEQGELSIDDAALDEAEQCAAEGAGLPFIQGELIDGGTWIVADDPNGGLCVTLRTVDLGCDDGGPVVPAGAPPGTPRIAVDEFPAEIAEGEAGELAYAELPIGSTTVQLQFADGSTAEAETVDLENRIWGMPVRHRNLPQTVNYFDAEDVLVASFEVYGD